LINNAIKFTEKGSITLNISVLENRGDSIVLKFTVQDSGIGISPDDLDSLFKAFNQGDSSTTRKYGGTGLGLTIAKNLVKMFNGEIYAESDQGKGSVFTFTAQFKLVNQLKLNSSKEYHFEGAKILLVEDNIINQELVCALLTKINVQTEIASDGFEAIEKIKSNKFDLVLMDMQLPEIDGLHTAQIIRKNYSKTELPIIALTANVSQSNKDQCLSVGMNDYLTKPIETDNLYQILSSYLKETNSRPKIIETNIQKIYDLTENEGFPINLPGFNLHEGLQRLNNNKELYQKVLKQFAQENHNFIDKLTNLLKKQQIEEAEILVHNLKGIAGNLSAEPLFNLLTDLDELLKNSELSSAFSILPKLNQVMSMTLHSIKELNPLVSDVVVIGEKKLTKEELRSYSEKFYTLIKSGNFEAPEYWEEIRGYFSNQIEQSILEQITINLNNYQYEETTILFEEMLAKINITITQQ